MGVLGMAEKSKKIDKKLDASAVKQALANLKTLTNCKGALTDLALSFCDFLTEYEGVLVRVGELELLTADLSARLDNAELRAGIVKTSRIAEGTLEIPLIVEAEVQEVNVNAN